MTEFDADELRAIALGAAAAWSTAAHQLECLAAELLESDQPDAAARAGDLAAVFALKAAVETARHRGPR